MNESRVALSLRVCTNNENKSVVKAWRDKTVQHKVYENISINEHTLEGVKHYTCTIVIPERDYNSRTTPV